jgi:hypothetical protein
LAPPSDMITRPRAKKCTHGLLLVVIRELGMHPRQLSRFASLISLYNCCSPRARTSTTRPYTKDGTHSLIRRAPPAAAPPPPAAAPPAAAQLPRPACLVQDRATSQPQPAITGSRRSTPTAGLPCARPRHHPHYTRRYTSPAPTSNRGGYPGRHTTTPGPHLLQPTFFYKYNDTCNLLLRCAREQTRQPMM